MHDGTDDRLPHQPLKTSHQAGLGDRDQPALQCGNCQALRLIGQRSFPDPYEMETRVGDYVLVEILH